MNKLSAVIVTFALLSAGCSHDYSNHRDFHLYILAGQSNMAGRGKVQEQDMQVHPRVYVLNQNDEWELAKDPLHFDKPGIVGVGPGLAFGKAMAGYKKRVRIGLIPCAAGGSPISSWTKGGYHDQTKSHPYDDAVRRARAAMQSGVLKGIIWHQGESDSKPEKIQVYQAKHVELIAGFRQDLGDEEIRFVVARLGDFYVERNPDAESINRILANIPDKIENTACVDVSGLTHKGDVLHFDTRSSRELGGRYAELMIKLERRK
ncbi:MAG TPA: sialate O-acetylesterase [Sedimentisphaerales bacterium]|nr:sialate O-acetylesterase [Sedimentisphaerales bacterium]